MYAIVDIETTGRSAKYARITEIAILIHDGHQVIEEYQTLLNPEEEIPASISALTGISNEMVKDAPRFEEVADQIYELLSRHIFVAHNVNFDYSFIKNQFQELGVQLNCKKLCTIRLGRKIFPGLKSYSLGHLCNYLGIINQAQHRALGDARATAMFMDRLIENGQDQIELFLRKESKNDRLPPHLSQEIFELLPEQTGVYYFLNQAGAVLYVGKANNIKKRVATHFSTTDVISKQGLKDQIHDINYELCGDEMIAFLLEAHEIKKYFPPFNKAQKYPQKRYGIYHYQDGLGEDRLSIAKVQRGIAPMSIHPSFDSARDTLIEIVRRFNLDPRKCGLPTEVIAKYELDPIDVSDQQGRFKMALLSIQVEYTSYVLEGKGRSTTEKSIVLVDEGVYKGFLFVPCDFSVTDSIVKIKKDIRRFPDDGDTKRIINQFKDKRKMITLS